MISLIIVTYNSVHCLPALFASLVTTQYPNYEIIIVDNASQDTSVETARALVPHAHMIVNDHNLGFGRACNRGAAAAQGEWLLFMNPDLVLTPEWLDKLLSSAAAAPDAALLSPETLPLTQQSDPVIPGSVRQDNPAKPDKIIASTTQFSQIGGASVSLDESAALPGCALMMRRAAWEQIGGFDEHIFLYWEDTELCWRAWLLGWRVLVAHDAIVFHERGGSGGGSAWAIEAASNGLYTHLKLMRWRRVLRYMLRLALKTMLHPRLYQAWLRNLRNLGDTLATRRRLLAQRVIDPARLEAMIDVHRKQQS